MLTRRGVTLVELLVSMALLGIIGAAATGALVQQTRLRTRVVSRAAAAVQLRGALAPLLADLDAVSPPEGDIPPGEARDSTLELRATRAEGVVCAVAGAELHVAMLSSVRGRDVIAGDVAWLHDHGTWRGEPIGDAQWVTAVPPDCTHWTGSGRRVIRISLATSDGIVAGQAARFTRRIRYSFYRAGDGGTYLGLREWNATSGAFTGVQPIAGPFDRRWSRFTYHDTLGIDLPSGTAATAEIAAVFVRIGAAAAPGDVTPDTASVRIALRNRQ